MLFRKHCKDLTNAGGYNLVIRTEMCAAKKKDFKKIKTFRETGGKFNLEKEVNFTFLSVTTSKNFVENFQSLCSPLIIYILLSNHLLLNVHKASKRSIYLSVICVLSIYLYLYPFIGNKLSWAERKRDVQV